MPCPKPLVIFALIFAKDYKVTLYMIEANMMSKIINVEIQLDDVRFLLAADVSSLV
jgi:hypothetical protein